MRERLRMKLTKIVRVVANDFGQFLSKGNKSHSSECISGDKIHEISTYDTHKGAQGRANAVNSNLRFDSELTGRERFTVREALITLEIGGESTIP